MFVFAFVVVVVDAWCCSQGPANTSQQFTYVCLGPPNQPLLYTCSLVANTQPTTTIVCSTEPGSGSNNIFTVFAGYGSSAQNASGVDVFSYPVAPVVLGVKGCTPGLLLLAVVA